MSSLARGGVARLREILRPASRVEVVLNDAIYRLMGVRLYGNGPREQSVLPGAKIKTDKLARVRSGDVVYNKMWTGKGSFAVVGNEFSGCYVTSEYPIFEVDELRLDVDYLRHSMTLSTFWDRAATVARGSTSRARLHPRDFLDLEIWLPPLTEQRKIAAILSSVDETIEKTQAVIGQVQVVKKGLMQELLTKGLPGRHKSFKQTEIGRIPAEWEVAEIGDLAEFSGGHGFRPSDWSASGLPIIRIQNLNGSGDFNYYSGEPDPRWIVPPGELLFAWAGSRGASFGPCLWPGPLGVLNQHIHRVSPNERANKAYLYHLLASVTTEIERRAHGFKSTLVHLKKGDLVGWKVALPPISEQLEILEILRSVSDRIDAEHRVLGTMATLKSALQSLLLTGELRVRPDPPPPPEPS